MDDRTYLQLEPDEEILLIRHRHFINILPILVSSVLVIAVAIFTTGWLSTHSNPLQELISAAQLSLVLMILAGLALLIAALAFLIYRQTRIILTNRHFVQITQSGLFGRSTSKLTLDEIQDVRGTRRGFFATIFNYGEILVETAGEEENFLFTPVADPLDLAETINDAHRKYGHRPGV